MTSRPHDGTDTSSDAIDCSRASSVGFGRRPTGSNPAGLSVLALLLFLPSGALAARRVRPLFEPTDLELETPGVVEIDLQLGIVQGQGPARLVVPDFEIDLGITRWLEIGIDGAYAVEGPAVGPFSLDHSAPDSLWLAAKIGLWDLRDEQTGDAWAIGLQLGPKLPIASGSHGIGVEGLLLLGRVLSKTHLVLNAGAFVDPNPDPQPSRPAGIELGLDVERDIDAGGVFSWQAEVAGVSFVSEDPAQLLVTAGLTWAARANLDLSLIGLWGFLAGNDQYGVLFGLSPKFQLF